jgi:energy-coupling factor transport system substrate-specific component
MKQNKSFYDMSLPAICIAINLAIGTIVKALSLPVYLDSIGTIMATILIGYRAGIYVGVIGFVFMSILNPITIYFVFTQASIAIFIGILNKINFFSSSIKIVISGITTGIVSAIVSAPVIYYIFQGATANGASLVTTIFIKLGYSVSESIIFSGLILEPIDKLIQCLIVFYILKNIPKKYLPYFENNNNTKTLSYDN